MDSANLYNKSALAWLEFKTHDLLDNALQRWFDNYKLDEQEEFASMYEWMVVEEVEATAKHIKKKYLCTIGDDDRGVTREVEIDHTAPPPPLTTFAARLKRTPPPKKSITELRREAEWVRLSQRSTNFVPEDLYGFTATGFTATGRKQRPAETQQLLSAADAISVDDLLRAMHEMAKNHPIPPPPYMSYDFNPLLPIDPVFNLQYEMMREMDYRIMETMLVPRREVPNFTPPPSTKHRSNRK